MRVAVRFQTQRIHRNLLEAAKVIEVDLPREAKSIASEVADKWSNRIKSSGRGGRWNSQMARIETSFTTPKSGALFVRMGWLGSPPPAADGRTTWFAYHDTGYHAFGGPTFVPGLMAQMDARRDLTRRYNELAEDIARKAESKLGDR